MRGRRSKDDKYRSRLEARVAELIPDAEYESDKIKYVVPASKHSYLTDFKLGPNNFIEVKGRLTSADRKKYLLVSEQNPDITLRFFFDKSSNKLYKGSPTSYADWAEKSGFEWTDSRLGIPDHWLEEK